MTEGTEEAERPTGDITFRDRVITVRMPLPEQILIWRRTLQRLQTVDPDNWTVEEVLTALERSRKIIDSLLINSVDVEWLDDEMLAGRVTLRDTSELVTSSIKAFHNREDRRAASKAAKAPAKKATRKKAVS